MLFSSASRKLLAVGCIALAGMGLGACTFMPVYSDAVQTEAALALAYAKPNSRLEQLVYQELSLRLGRSESQTAPLAQVTVATGAADLVLSQTANPNKAKEVTATVTLTITPRDGSGIPVRAFTRRATANYATTGQVLADNSAAADASERATRAAAESLRLAVLADLSR